MPHCKACDSWFDDRKDSTGQYVELCWPCDKASKIEATLAVETEPREPVDREEYALRLSVALSEHDWGEGLGIGMITEEQRRAHLCEVAERRFWDAVDMGGDFLAALDHAIGSSRFRGDQRGIL